MSRVASWLAESTTTISKGGSWTTKLSSNAAMFLASLRTVVTTLTSNAAGRRRHEGRGPRDRSRGHEHDRRGGPPGEEAGTAALPRRSRDPVLRQDDARGAEPDRRGPALGRPLRADEHVADEPRTGERDGGRPRRREQRDRRADPEPRDRGKEVRRPRPAGPEPSSVRPPHIPPRGERGREGTAGAGPEGVRRGRGRGGRADRLP